MTVTTARAWVLETITMQVPDEPPDRSVVVDETGTAWQRRGDLWTGAHVYGRFESSWPHLLADHRTLTLVYIGRSS